MKIFFEEREKTRQKKAETMETKTEMLFICIADGRIHTLKGSFHSMRKKSPFAWNRIDSDIEFNKITANLVFE